MNPLTGKPEFHKLFALQYKKKLERENMSLNSLVPGESNEMKWVSRTFVLWKNQRSYV